MVPPLSTSRVRYPVHSNPLDKQQRRYDRNPLVYYSVQCTVVHVYQSDPLRQLPGR